MKGQIDVAKITKFTGLRDSVYALAISQDKSAFYSGSGDGFIVEWKPALSNDGTLIARMDKSVWALEFHNENAQLFAGNSVGEIYSIDLVQKKTTIEIKAHNGGVFILKQIGNELISGGQDGILKRWDEAGKQVSDLALSSKSLRDCAFHPEEPYLAVAGSDGFIRILDHDEKIHQTLQGHDGTVFCVAFSPCGKFLLSGGKDATLRVWELASGKELNKINAHWFHIHSMAFSPDGTKLITSSLDKTIRVWEWDSMKLIKVIDREKNNAHTNSVNKVLWIDSKQFISCSDDRTIILTQLTE
jgi:WD repeat-containing protein 61